MKKLKIITICASMVLSLVACSNDSTVKDNSTKQTTEDNVQIPNPLIDCDTITDAEKIAGFTVVEPTNIPAGYTLDSIRAIKGGIIEINYMNGGNIFSYRQGKGSEDISGNFNEYKENNTITVGSLQVMTKGDNGKISVATWTSGEYTYAILAEGLDTTAISDMINSTLSDAGVQGEN